nr:hypothetical protein [uncultured Glaciecola sp.]
MSKWQSFDKVCSIYKQLQDLLPCQLTVITKDKDIANSTLNEFNITNYKLLSADRKQVLEMLANADFGFVYREANVVNETASPIKFLEYTSQGVIPLITNAVGDYSALASSVGISISIEDEATIIAKNIYCKLQNKDTLRKLYEV